MVVQPNKAIVGANAFAHESGIHQDGVLKNRLTYEIVDARTVGLSAITASPWASSAAAVLFGLAWKSWATTSPGRISMMPLRASRILADRKREITDRDLEAIVSEQVQQPDAQVSTQVCAGELWQQSLSPTATVTLDR